MTGPDDLMGQDLPASEPAQTTLSEEELNDLRRRIVNDDYQPTMEEQREAVRTIIARRTRQQQEAEKPKGRSRATKVTVDFSEYES